MLNLSFKIFGISRLCSFLQIFWNCYRSLQNFPLFLLKKSTYKWTHAVQISGVQRSIGVCFYIVRKLYIFWYQREEILLVNRIYSSTKQIFPTSWLQMIQYLRNAKPGTLLCEFKGRRHNFDTYSDFIVFLW